MNDKSKWLYLIWREQERKRDISDGINEKLPKMQSFLGFTIYQLLH